MFDHGQGEGHTISCSLSRGVTVFLTFYFKPPPPSTLLDRGSLPPFFLPEAEGRGEGFLSPSLHFRKEEGREGTFV